MVVLGAAEAADHRGAGIEHGAVVAIEAIEGLFDRSDERAPVRRGEAGFVIRRHLPGPDLFQDPPPKFILDEDGTLVRESGKVDSALLLLLPVALEAMLFEEGADAGGKRAGRLCGTGGDCRPAGGTESEKEEMAERLGH